MTQTIISHYRVLHQLGEGGMGVVFCAEDLRLGREVAIKFLRADEPDQEQWLARFEREARLASALKHPHICTIHELGEHAGRPFIVMELLEGRTIKQLLLEHGRLSVPEVIAFSIQIADALQAAHERGIVHRDIKPANLFVMRGDRLKVLDFGLAKVAAPLAVPVTGPLAPSEKLQHAGPEVTATGATVGTAAYMSPEQATGAPIDARTDLFSFGSVIYEMLTGKRAFPGDSVPAVLQRLVAGEYIPATALVPTIPPALNALVDRALRTDKLERYQTAAEMLEDLRALEREASSRPAVALENVAAPKVARPPSTSGRWRLGAVALAAMLVVLVGWRWLGGTAGTAALTDRDSILMAEFLNNTGDEVFDQSLLTALKVQLGQSPFLDIVTDERVAETLAHMGQPAEAELTSGIARDVCQRLGVKAMLEGSISRLGSNYVLMLGASDCATGASIAREQGEATSREAVLRTLGTLSASMRTKLGESLPSLQRFGVPIEQATTPSLPALKAYAMGVAERRRARELESIGFFNQAIALDGEFAAAYTMLSTVYGTLGEWRQSEEYARQAYARHQRVSERERLFIEHQYHDRVTGDLDKAVEALEVWKLSYPRDFRPPNALALIHNRVGRYDKAAAEAREALQRSPGHPFPLSNLAFALRGLGQYAEARKVAEEAVSLGVATTPTRRLLYQLGVLAGDGSEKGHLDWSRDRPREFDLLSAQAQVAAFEGRLREATDLYLRASEKAQARGLKGTATNYAAHLAWTEALYGDPSRAAGRVGAIVRDMGAAAEGPDVVLRYRAAAGLALVGLTEEARDIAARAEQQYPHATVVRTVIVPSVAAATALWRGRPDDAIAALEAARPTERGTSAALMPIYLRAQAYLAGRRPLDAVREFQALLDARGADPFAPVVPLARLGLARAWALAGDPVRSREAYEELFRLWSRAEPDLPVLGRARAEYARAASAAVAAPTR